VPSTIIKQGLGVWDLLVVVAYMAWMLGIGVYYSKRQTDTSEYFLGGRGMGWLIVGISTMATLVSTITYLTTPGEIVANGFGVLWGQLSIYLAFPIIGYLIIPRIMAHEGMVSGYQLLERQFGMSIRQAAAFLFVLTRMSWTGLIVYTCSRAVSQMTGWPLAFVILAVGIITVSYTTMGGIRAVIITDVTQAVILFGGALAVVVFAMFAAHSVTAWWPNLHDPVVKAGLAWPKIKLFSLDPTDRITILGIIFMYFCFWVVTASSDQLAIQRYLSTKDTRAARKSFLANAVSNTFVGITLVLCGVALLGYFLKNVSLIPPVDELLRNKQAILPDVTQKMASMSPLQQKVFTLKSGGDDLFPWFIAHILPAGLSGVLIAALFSAAMSSVSSGVNSVTTVLMVDFPRIFTGDLDERGKVRRARIIGVSVGMVALVITFIQHMIKGNFMEVAQKINGFFVAPMAALFFMAFFVKRVTRQGAWVSIVVGFLIGVVVSYYGEISKALTGTEVKVSFMFILPLSLIGAILAGYLVSVAFPAPKRDAER
jgi:SSS family solute:Na+ symporter